jgi:hypothetical protein
LKGRSAATQQQRSRYKKIKKDDKIDCKSRKQVKVEHRVKAQGWCEYVATTICSTFLFYRQMMIEMFMYMYELEVKTSDCQAGVAGFDPR